MSLPSTCRRLLDHVCTHNACRVMRLVPLFWWLWFFWFRRHGVSSLDTHASLHTCPWRDTRPVTSSRGRRLEETELRDLPAPPADSGSGVCACPMESDLEKGRVRLRFTNQACAEQWRESERREKGRVVGRKSGIVREGREVASSKKLLFTRWNKNIARKVKHQADGWSTNNAKNLEPLGGRLVPRVLEWIRGILGQKVILTSV